MVRFIEFFLTDKGKQEFRSLREVIKKNKIRSIIVFFLVISASLAYLLLPS